MTEFFLDDTSVSQRLSQLGAKPEFVPAWVWYEYALSIKYLDIDPYRCPEMPCAKNHAGDVRVAILADARSAVIWPALKRLAVKFGANKEAAKLKGLESEDEQKPRAVFELLDFVVKAAAPPRLPDALSASARARHGTRIVDLVKNLCQELSAIRESSAGPMPREFTDAALDAANSHICGTYTGEPKEYFDAQFEMLEGKMARHWTRVFASIDEILGPEYLSLRAIRIGAENWMGTAPRVYRINSAGAWRQHFIVQMTEYFERWYGTPCSGITSTLSTILFGVDTDKVVVTKLARRKRKSNKS